MNTERVISIVARVSRKKPESIQTHLSLATLGLNSSFGLSALRSFLESDARAKLPPLTANMKVSDVVGLLSGIKVQPATAQPAPRPVQTAGRAAVSMPQNMGMGLDMQEISSLPDVKDFRTDEFYKSHFLPNEISTAMLKPDPRAHLCGIFCAKEAAKKSHPDLLNLRMVEINVTHDQSGRPLLNLMTPSNYTFVVSITHTEQFAAATCLTMWP